MRSRPSFADLCRFNAAVLQQAQDVAAAYRLRVEDFASRTGPHLRHVIEHFEALLLGLERGVVDYDHRERDRGVETDPATCIARLEALVPRLLALQDRDPTQPLAVGSVIGLQGDAFSLSQSSLARELQFVASHAIHHFALLQPVLAAAGVAVPADFGRAPETVRYQQMQALW
jgi:hypothetical protein